MILVSFNNNIFQTIVKFVNVFFCSIEYSNSYRKDENECLHNVARSITTAASYFSR